MDRVPLERQIAVLRRQFRRIPKDDVKVLQSAEQTLSRLLALRQHLEHADHDDEAESDALVKELLALLGLPCPPA